MTYPHHRIPSTSYNFNRLAGYMGFETEEETTIRIDLETLARQAKLSFTGEETPTAQFLQLLEEECSRAIRHEAHCVECYGLNESLKALNSRDESLLREIEEIVNGVRHVGEVSLPIFAISIAM